jgi:hypothetical protein
MVNLQQFFVAAEPRLKLASFSDLIASGLLNPQRRIPYAALYWRTHNLTPGVGSN